MNAANRTGKILLSPIGLRKKALAQIALCVLGGLLLTSSKAQAASVSLGVTTQNLTLTGIGPNASGLGQFFVTMGACSPAGGNTTCILSGAFTGTTPGLTSGTYTMATVYVGTGTTPLQGLSQSAGSEAFGFAVVPATTTITLTLVSSSGTFVVPMYAGGQFVPGTAFNFSRSPGSGTCSGPSVPTCSGAQVGLVAGAVLAGPVIGGASFSSDYYLSQLAFSGAWQSTLTFVNYSAQQVTCTTNFYTDSGSPMSVPFSQGTSATRTDVIPPGGSVHDQTTGSAKDTVQGWARASCTGPVQASLLYRLYNNSGVPIGEAAVNAEATPTTKFATFAQTNTAVAYANPSTTQPTDVTITVYDSAGAQLGSTVINLGPLAHGAALLGQLLGLSNFTGFVKITSTNPVISLSLNAEASPVFSSLPPGDLPASTALVP